MLRSMTGFGRAERLVDGYNIIFAWENLKNIAKDSLESARTELINILTAKP